MNGFADRFAVGSKRWPLRGTPRGLAVGLIVGAATLAVPGVVGAAAAAEFNVTGTADGVAACSGSSCPTLRSAVLASNEAGGTNTINLPAGEYTLTLTPTGIDDGNTGDLHVEANLTIAGAGAGATTIRGDEDRVLDITAEAATVSGVTITGGSTATEGGAIRDRGASLTVSSDVLSANSAASSGFGGAIYMAPEGSATLTVTNSIFSSNTAENEGTSGGGFGGAVMFEPEQEGTMTVTNSEFDKNVAQTGSSFGGGFGGAIMFEPFEAGTLTINGSTFSSNVAEGSSAQGGFGGAIMFQPSSPGSALTVTNSTLTGNQAGGKSGFGGGIMFQPEEGSSGTLTHVTMVGNATSAASQGGGIYIEESPVTIRNSIVSGNTGAGAPDDCDVESGGLTAQGHNVELGTSCGFDINANPLVAALASNGGATRTMALLEHSPAIDAALPAFCPLNDQRGVSRPDDAGTPCDIGAYESVAPPVTTPPAGPPTTGTPTPITTILLAPHGTRILASKFNRKKHAVTFRFTAAGTVTGFECGLVKVRKHHRKPKLRFGRCPTPKTYKHLKPGSYVFEVRAFNSAGRDPRPAVKKFRLKGH